MVAAEEEGAGVVGPAPKTRDPIELVVFNTDEVVLQFSHTC